MASLGTPERQSLHLSNAGISKGAQSRCPKECNVTATYSDPLARSHPNQDIPTTA
jgi:hypothetical protein